MYLMDYFNRLWDEPIHRIEQAATKDSSLHVIHGIIGSPMRDGTVKICCCAPEGL